MKIKMTPEEFYDGGYNLLTAEGIRSLENVEEVLFAYPDSSWLEDEQGTTDNGPFRGFWHGLMHDVEKSLFAILTQSDFHRSVQFYETLQDVSTEWEDLLMSAWDNARDVGELEAEFDITIDEYADYRTWVMAEREEVSATEFEGMPKILNKLIDLLERFNPTGYGQWEYCSPFGIIPAHALEDHEAVWWSEEAEGVKVQLMDALSEVSDANVSFVCVSGSYGYSKNS